MSPPILACGPDFAPDALAASLVMYLLVKPLAYFGFIRAFRYRVSRAIPMTTRQAVKLAAWRSFLGFVLVGGGAIAFAQSNVESGALIGWIYAYVTRVFSWWIVGKLGASLRGHRMVGWVIGGTLLNIGFDIATVAGLLGGFLGMAVVVIIIGVVILAVEQTGKRAELQMRFSKDPLCLNCGYNLTGNLSGVCPECGTAIGTPNAGGRQAHPEHA